MIQEYANCSLQEFLEDHHYDIGLATGLGLALDIAFGLHYLHSLEYSIYMCNSLLNPQAIYLKLHGRSRWQAKFAGIGPMVMFITTLLTICFCQLHTFIGPTL